MSTRGHVHLWVCWLLLLANIGMAQNPGFVSLEGRQFMVDGQEFYPRVMNYEMEYVINGQPPHDPNDVYISCSSWYDEGHPWQFNCSGPSTCDADLTEQFDRIAAMGYNTIRIVHWTIPFLYLDANNEQKYRVLVRTWPGNQNPYLVAHELVEPDFTDAWSELMFSSLRRIIQLARASGLRSILLCADQEISTICRDMDAVALYESYLERLGEELKDEEGLIAYDLWNEPIWSNYNEMSAWTKGEICEFVARWYDALHVHDPDHLVTVGGIGPSELPWWDPTLLKLDFYSIHAYPDMSIVDGYSVPNSVDRILHDLYWTGAAGVMPFIIGETAFGADDDQNHAHGNTIYLDADPAHHQWPYQQGNELEQAAYMQTTMDATRNFMGSGYSWWGFQNSHGQSLTGTTLQNASGYRGCYYGLLHFGNDFNSDALYKLAASYHVNYTPPPLPAAMPNPTAAYYNPFGFTGPVYRNYTVVDLNQDPIENAIVEAKWKYGNIDPLGQDEYLWNRIPTDANGAIAVHPPDGITGYLTPVADGLRTSATGAQSVGSGIPWPQDGYAFELERDALLADVLVDGVNLYTNDYRNDKAWYLVGITNTTVHGNGTTGGTLDAHARQVSAGPGFHAQKGSAVHLWAEKTFADCSSQAYRLASTAAVGTEEATSTRTVARKIELQFDPVGTTLSASPNPCRASTTLSFVGVSGSGQLSVYDAQGLLVTTEQISGDQHMLVTSNLRSGTYRVSIAFGSDLLSTSFTKLP